MLKELLDESLIDVNVSVNDWKEAIQAVGNLLVKNDYAEGRYTQAMIDSVIEYGPYIVIDKGIALAHARPEAGSKRIGLAIVTLNPPINFGLKENDPVQLIFGLSAIDSSSHLDLCADLANILLEDGAIEEICSCKSAQEIYDLLKRKG